MKNLILPIAMNSILATTLNAQGPLPMTPTTNWLAASHETLGATAPAGWFMDLEADEMEIYVTPERALVLVDRAPITEKNGAAHLGKGVRGLGGTHLSLVGEVESVNDHVLHGLYSGLLAGTAVLMDQFVQLRNGVPVAIVRVITRVNGSAPMINNDQRELVLALLDKPVALNAQALTKF